MEEIVDKKTEKEVSTLQSDTFEKKIECVDIKTEEEFNELKGEAMTTSEEVVEKILQLN